MSYAPTEWNTGDVITADKLNNIEQGILTNESSFVVIVGRDDDDGNIYTDFGYELMTESFNNGKMPVLKLVDYGSPNTFRQYAFMSGFDAAGNIYFTSAVGVNTMTHEFNTMNYLFTVGNSVGRVV